MSGRHRHDACEGCRPVVRSRDLALRATDLEPGVAEGFLRQRKWFFNAETGDDRNAGDSHECQLRTFAEFQRRVGYLTTIGVLPSKCVPCSVGNVVELRYTSDMPRSDPFNFANYVAAGSVVHVRSDRIVLLEGAFVDVIEKDRTTNQPRAVAAPGIASYVGKWLLVTSGEARGSRAFIMRDLGGDVVQITEWANGILGADVEDDGIGFGEPLPDGTLFPSAPPAPGDSFEVIDFYQLTLGNMVVGYRPERGAGATPEGEAFRIPGGLLFREVHVRDSLPEDGEEPGPPCETSAVPGFPQPIGLGTTVGGFMDAIVDTEVTVPGGAGNAVAFNVLFRGQVTQLPGSYLFLGLGGSLNYHVGQYPGYLLVEQGATAVIDGDPVGMGDIENPEGPLYGDINNAGDVHSGPISFWNTNHGLVARGGGFYTFEATSPFYGETGYVPFWGRNNLQVSIQPQSFILIEQFIFGGGPSQPPAFEAGAFGSNPLSPVLVQYGCLADRAWTNDPATQLPRPVGGIETRWADLLVPAPAGFLVCTEDLGDGFEQRISEMLMPNAYSGLHFGVFVIP